MPVVGLANLGNTCYINTAIQCLGHCPSFVSFLKNSSSQKDLPDLHNQITDVVTSLWEPDIGSIIPKGFLNAVQRSLPSMRLHEENDIQEFLIVFLDKLNEGLASRITKVPRSLQLLTHSSPQLLLLQSRADAAWLNQHAKEYSPLIPLIHGQSISQIICGHCQKIFHNYETFSLLMLSILKTKDSIETALKRHMDHEYVNTEVHAEHWTCDGCHNKAKSLKSTKLWRLPKVLMLCLKRFTSDLQKNDCNIDVQHTLDLTSLNLGPSNYSVYDLCAIACHIGCYGGGHYHALCKRNEETWCKIDDTFVTPCPPPSSTTSGYIFFYQLRDSA